MSIVKFKNQNYEKIRSNCLRKVELYTDPEFPANHTSLFKSKRLLAICNIMLNILRIISKINVYGLFNLVVLRQ